MPDIQLEFDKLWDWGNPAESERRFRLSAEEAAKAGDTPRELNFLTQAMRALVLQRRFDDATTVCKDVYKRMGEIRDNRVNVRLCLEMGRWDNDLDRKERARTYFDFVVSLARSMKMDYQHVDALHMLAVVSPPEEAMEWHDKAIAVASASEDPRTCQWLATLLNNRGWTQFDLGQHEAALATLEEALKLRYEMGQPGPIRIARFCVAKVKRVLGRVEEALAKQRALIAEHHGQAADVPVWVKTDGFGNEEIGECLLALGQPEAARPHFMIAYDVLSKDPWLVPREPDRIARLKQLAGGDA